MTINHQLDERQQLESLHSTLIAKKSALCAQSGSNECLMRSEQKKANELAQEMKALERTLEKLKNEVQELGQEKDALSKKLKQVSASTSSAFAVSILFALSSPAQLTHRPLAQ